VAVSGADRRFGAALRLHRAAEFKAVLAHRRSVRSEHFVLNYAPNPQGSARLGLVVGRKADRRAVGRNLVKRLARESFRMHRPRLPACDLVLRAVTPQAGLSRRALRAEIDGLMARLIR
jgi:ribonuclease P protein component